MNSSPLLTTSLAFMFGIFTLFLKEAIESLIKREKGKVRIEKIKNYILDNINEPIFYKVIAEPKNTWILENLQNFAIAGNLQIQTENLLEIIENQKTVILPYLSIHRYLRFIELSNSLTNLRTACIRVQGKEEVKDRDYATIKSAYGQVIIKCNEPV